MKNNKLQKISISVSREHEKYLPDITAALGDFKVKYVGGLMRFSAQEMAMQVMIFLTTAFVGGAAWDLLKIGIKKVLKKFPKSYVVIRGNDSVMYTVRPDMSINVIVTPDRAKEFKNIKSFDDLATYMRSQEQAVQKNIPGGWKEIKLASVFDFKNGLNKEKRFFGHGSPIINYMDVNRGGGLYVKNILGMVDVNKSELDRFNVRRGDVFFTRTSETLKEIGFSAVALDDFKNTVFSGFVLRARPRGSVLLPGYAKYCFTTPQARQEIMEKSSYTTRALTSGSLLNHVKIDLPPIAEQNRIVSVLETWDRTIEELAKKIKVKKNIKKGLMQNLLTGKVRLAGFDEKWAVASLDELCNISTGKKDVNEGDPSGQYPFFTCAREHTHSNDYSYDMEAILIAGNADVGHCKYFNGKFEAYQRTYILSKFTNINVIFLFFFLSYFFKNHVESLKQIGAMSYIKLPMLEGFFVKIPKIKEQKMIADILTTANEEIKSLEKKIAVLKDQKKYLLNNLITGTIRTKA